MKDIYNKEQYRAHHIKKLNGYGIYEGPNGESLLTWDYYELLRFVSLEEIRQDDEPLRSAWI